MRAGGWVGGRAHTCVRDVWRVGGPAGHNRYAPMEAGTRRRLGEFFRPHNERLYRLLAKFGVTFTPWELDIPGSSDVDLVG